METSEWTGRYVVLHGATSRVAVEVGRSLRAAGARVGLIGRDEGRVAEVARALDAPYRIAPATDADAITSAISALAEEAGRLDGIVNCAGTVLLKPAHLTTSAEWDETIGVNLTSSFGVVRAAGKLMSRTGGSVVLLSSAAARIGLANHEAIAAAKAGVEGLVRSAAATYAARGLRFNAVAPGLVRTPLSERLFRTEAAIQASLALHPLRRLGEPGDVARVIAFLLEPANSWISGQTLGVDGGLAGLK